MSTIQPPVRFLLVFLAVSAIVAVSPAGAESDAQQTRHVVLGLRFPPQKASSSAPTLSPGEQATIADPSSTSWIPPDLDSVVPPVQAGAACPLTQVVGAAGQRMRELIENLQRFNAKENVEHFRVDSLGSRSNHQTRLFDYDVNITLSKSGVFLLDEYRNGTTNPAQFPERIATQGLSAMALVLHPLLVSDFNLTCEGLGKWNGRPAWQVRFEQRADRPNRIRGYVVESRVYPEPLKGRVWIDANTYQVQHLESELLAPIPQIALTEEHMLIDYGPVQFQGFRQLWLPLNADVYWERRGHRYYRRHTFSDFKLFGVQSAQQMQPPKESYCLENTSDRDVAGILTVSPSAGASSKSVSITFTIPSRRKVCKLIGPGKDLSIPVAEVGPATFAYNSRAGAIIAEVNLAGTLDLIPESDVASLTH